MTIFDDRTYAADCDNPIFQEGLDELEALRRLAYSAAYWHTIEFCIDPSVVRGLEYYTGPVFEVDLTFPITGDDGKPVRFGSVSCRRAL